MNLHSVSSREGEQRKAITKDDRLCFIHLLKTGGTTLVSHLVDQFDVQAAFVSPFVEEFMKLSPQRARSYRLISGHFPFQLALNWKLSNLVTLLRDPVQRSVSHYKHIGRDASYPHSALFRTAPFEEVLKDKRFVFVYSNYQAFALGCNDLDLFMRVSTLFEPKPEIRAEEALEAMQDPANLDRAIRRLKACFAVGITEELNVFGRVLSACFGWPKHGHFPFLNAAPSGESNSPVSQRAHEALVAATVLDRRLYEEARRLARDRDAGHGAEAIDGYLEKRFAHVAPATQVRFGFEKPLFGNGWYGRELDSDGEYRRWMGPSVCSTVRIRLEPGRDYTVSARIASLHPDLSRGIKVKINERPVPVHSWPVSYSDAADRVVHALLPRQLVGLRLLYTEIAFVVPRTICPAKEFPGETDTRELGIRFSWLEISPVE